MMQHVLMSRIDHTWNMYVVFVAMSRDLDPDS